MTVRAVPKTARVSATERFHRSARRGPSPVALLLGGIAAAGALAVGAILFWPTGPTDETLDARVDGLERDVAKFEDDGRYLDRLVAEYGASDRYRTRASGWRTRARIDRELDGDLKRLSADFAAWKPRAERAQKEAVRAVWEEGVGLKRRAAKAPVPWKPELERLQADLENRMKPASESWQVARERIASECRLEQRGQADWSKALSLWQAYLAGSVGPADRSGAESELRSIHARVREDLATLRIRVRQLRESGREEDARGEVAKHRARFKGTAAEPELEALLR
jgi:hypothetical protein